MLIGHVSCQYYVLITSSFLIPATSRKRQHLNQAQASPAVLDLGEAVFTYSESELFFKVKDSYVGALSIIMIFCFRMLNCHSTIQYLKCPLTNGVELSSVELLWCSRLILLGELLMT